MPYNLRPRRLPAGFWAKSSAPVRRRKVVVRRRRPAAAAAAPMYRKLAPIVKSIVARQEETKCMGLTVENGVTHNAQMTNADIQPLLAGQSQGTSSLQRVGDKIRPTLLKVKGCVSYYDRGQTVLSPMVVKIFCLQWKGLRDGSSGFGTVPLNQLLDSGGTVGAWDGSTIRSLWRINSDDFTVLGSRTLKISDTDVENHKSQTGHYEINIKPPAVLNYGPGSIYPSNYAPFFVMGWCYEDGSTPAITDVNIVNTCQSFLYYKDA